MDSPSEYYLDRGPKWFREAYNDLVDLIFQFQPLAGIGMTRNDSKLGRMLSVITFGSKGGSSVATPWQISVSGNDSDGYLATVRPGTVNSLLPSNIFDTFAVAAGANYIKIQCDTDGKTPTGITLSMDGTPTSSATLVAENVAPSTLWDLIGVVVQVVDTSTTNTVYQVRTKNLDAQPVIDFVVPVTPTNPGDEPFTRWWRWQLTDT